VCIICVLKFLSQSDRTLPMWDSNLSNSSLSPDSPHPSKVLSLLLLAAAPRDWRRVCALIGRWRSNDLFGIQQKYKWWEGDAFSFTHKLVCDPSACWEGESNIKKFKLGVLYFSFCSCWCSWMDTVSSSSAFIWRERMILCSVQRDISRFIHL